MRLRSGLIALQLVVAQAVGSQLRPTSEGARTPSIGQPGTWRATAGAAAGASREAGATDALTEARLGLQRAVGNPVMGVGILQFEGFAGSRVGRLDGGVRARFLVPFLRIGGGAEHNLSLDRTEGFLSTFQPIRRGGLFGDGSILRLDVVPRRDFTIRLGLEKPMWRRPPPGKSRPRLDHVPLSDAPAPRATTTPPAATAEALREAGERAGWIGRYVVPWLDHPSGNRARSERAVRAHLASLKAGMTVTDASGVARPRLMEDEVRAYHGAIERAFAGTLVATTPSLLPGDASARAALVAAKAREVVLEEVLLPYDRLLGQVKDDDTTNEYARRARGVFVRWLHLESGLPTGSVDGALDVFMAVLGIVEENRARMSAQWGDSRFVWLPLQYALRPEDHDTHAELDAIVERAVGDRFSGGNAVSYAINEQAQYEFSRMIRSARDYHVLWIHDFRGVDDQKQPDEQSYRQVLGSYLRAMTERARAYDSTGTFPTYIIIIDQWFYAWRDARLWMDLLEDPMRHRMRLPRGYEAWEAAIAAAQDSLRRAVAGSRLLQSQREQFGERWLRDLVKVHVNVTNTPDWSFQSRRLIRGIAVADNILRDHRKISFYDITEEDPDRGEGMFTGAGVGENYSNVTWEDRSLVVRGPAALHLKAVARQVLLDQGIDSTRIPFALQPLPMPAHYDSLVRAGILPGSEVYRALGVHNVTGYGPKDVNVAKAVLYTLMPPGSVVKLPDSLWNASFWGAAAAGCALRGGRVLMIAPAAINSPVPAFGSVEHAYELMWRLIVLQRELGPELEARGGFIRVGLFATQLDVTDIPGKLEAALTTVARHDWLRELVALDPSVVQALPGLITRWRGVEIPPIWQDYENAPRPKLHLKANFFATREAWTLMSQPGWDAITDEFISQRISQVQERRTAILDVDELPSDPTLRLSELPVRRWFDALDPATRERVMFYTTIGSHNHNFRSMVPDGEVAMIVSGWPALIPILDLISMIGSSEWPTTVAELDALHPGVGWLKTKLGHWARLVW